MSETHEYVLPTKPALTVTLPKDLVIAAVSIDPFYRMGLLGLLPQLHLVCFANDPLTSYLIDHGQPVLSLERSFPEIDLAKRNTESILQSPKLLDAIRSLGNPALFVYKNTEGVAEVAAREGMALIANDHHLSGELENKHAFRELLQGAGFAPYESYTKEEILGQEGQLYHAITARLGNHLVVQDDVLSGGKGTYMVHSESEWRAALISLRGSEEGGTRIVVSQFVTGITSSVQVCLTQYGPVWTGWQQQIVSNSDLCNPDVGGTEQFCGGAWGGVVLSDAMQQKLAAIVTNISTVLQGQGYKGIFGIDLITDAVHDEIYIIEVNARVTGMTPMLTLMQKVAGEIPLQLLHVLELARFPYTIADTSQLVSYNEKERKGSVLILHNKNDHDIALQQELPVGVYAYDAAGVCTFVREGLDPSAIMHENEFLIPDPPALHKPVEPYKRTMCIITNDCVVDTNGVINQQYKAVVAHLEGLFA